MWGHRHDFLNSSVTPSAFCSGSALADDSRTIFPQGPRTQLLLSSPYIGTLRPNMYALFGHMDPWGFAGS